jgi:hypothetical protein
MWGEAEILNSFKIQYFINNLQVSLKMTPWHTTSSTGITDVSLAKDDTECLVTVTAEWYKAIPETLLAKQLS